MKRIISLLICCGILVGCAPENQESRNVEEVASTPVEVTSIEKEQQVLSEEEVMISWDDFFDGEDVTKPSKKFQELSGRNVVIEGWMGEVLNIGQGWFLLIPAPGADCPFCSEDGNYWNKIMIVFVEDAKDLRHLNDKLVVRGRLDVGIKVDESNYRTMFRLYDATFEVASS